jgi:spermidine/putrescine transport system permease protein
LTRSLLALPTFAWTTLFFFVPLTVLTVYSFGQVDFITLDIRFGWTLDNYQRITDALYLSTVLRSLALSVGTTLACAVIGLPVAYFISRQPSTRQRVLVLAVIVPFWTGFLVRTYAWANLLANEGPLEDFAQTLGLLNGTLDVLYTPTAVAIGIVYGYLPLMILPIYVALERIDPALLEAAADLGASGRRTFRRVVLPLAKPGLLAGCIIVGIPATGEYVIPAILGGNKTLMYGNVVANQFFTVGDIPFGSALAVSLMVVLTVAVLLLRRRVPETSP